MITENSGAIPELPNYECGVAVNLSHTYEVEEECGEIETCTTTFTVDANPSGPLMVSCPNDESLPACSSESDIEDAYDDWITGFSYSGGCGAVTENSGAIPELPSYECGVAVNLSHTYEVEDDCGEIETCTTTFTVDANLNGPLMVSCPNDENLPGCSSESDIEDAYNDWITGFSYSGGCGTITENSGAIPELPNYECGVAVNLSHTYEVEDECGEIETCTTTFTLDANPSGPLMVSCPSDENLPACSSESDIEDAYNDWITGFS